jgi:hypothetical protein
MYIKRKEVGIAWVEKDYTLRGLEEILRHTPAGEKNVRETHAALVLEEHRKKQTPDRVREVSCHSSKGERVRALNRARQDAVFALAAAGGSRRIIIVKKVLSRLSLQRKA